MAFIDIDGDRCVGDGLCVESCPGNLLTGEAGGVPKGRPGAGLLCIRCGHCMGVCPTDAITLKGVEEVPLTPVDPGRRIDAGDAEHFLRTRRSIRCYKPEPVPRDVLFRVLETTRWAPSAMNRQPVRWLVVEDRDRVLELGGLVADGLRPIDYFQRMVHEWDAGVDRIFRGAPHVVVAYAKEESFDPAIDAVIALAYLELAACANGLGTCWAGVLMAAAAFNPAVPAWLDIPEGHKICGAMMIGYPNETYRQIPARNPLSVSFLPRQSIWTLQHDDSMVARDNGLPDLSAFVL